MRKKTMLALVAASAVTVASGSAFAAPQKLDKAKLDKVVAGAIVQVNGGGNTPNGNAFGVPSLNPAGHAPPGQNK